MSLHLALLAVGTTVIPGIEQTAYFRNGFIGIGTGHLAVGLPRPQCQVVQRNDIAFRTSIHNGPHRAVAYHQCFFKILCRPIVMQSQPCRVFSGPCHTCTEQSAHTGYNLYAPFQTSLFHKLSDFKFALLRHSAYSAPCRETRCRKQKYCFLFFRQYVVYEIRRNVPEGRILFPVFSLE